MSGVETKVPWYVALAVIAGFVAAIVYFGGYRPPHEAARRASCLNNIRQIGLAMQQYAEMHDGRCPDSFEILLKEGYLITTKVFRCPSSDDEFADEGYPKDLKNATLAELKLPEGNCSYTMIGGLKKGDLPDDFMLVYDKSAENHKGEGRNVFFNDGHVKWLTEEEFQERMKEQEARLRELR